MLFKDSGAARITYAHDERGNEVERAYFGVDGKPLLDKDYGAARITYAYDDRGNEIEEAGFGIDGKPVLFKDCGAARITYVYDDRGNEIEEAGFGIDGKPVLFKDYGAARITYVYDDRGNEIEEAGFGIDGKPVLSSKITVRLRITYVYDDRGNEIEEAGFGIDGKPVLFKDYGAARITYVYDERGNEGEQAYFGVDGKLITKLHKKGSDQNDHQVNFRNAQKDAKDTEISEIKNLGRAGPLTATALGELFWYAILARHFDEAFTAAERALKIAPEKIWLATNKAHALMFLGRAGEARALYLEYKGQEIEEEKTWEDEISDDLEKFREAGLTHPQMAEIEAAFAEGDPPATLRRRASRPTRRASKTVKTH